VKRLQIHRAVVFAFDHVLIDFAESRRHRAKRGLQAFGDARLRLLQTLVDYLAREISIYAVGEDDGNDREAELRDRAYLFGVADAHHRAFYRIGDELLDFGGGYDTRFGDDVDLVVSEVREGVYRQRGKSIYARAG
jgi:hypothetical protein